MADRSEEGAMIQKVCPVVFRISDDGAELLAFRHPTAGNQFVKGSIEEGELSLRAAMRELREESGITPDSGFFDLGSALIGEALWRFFAVEIDGLPEGGEHQTENDFGHVFSFFWHPLSANLDEDWHPHFDEAMQMIRHSLPL